MDFATPAGRAFWAFINCTSPITWAGLDVSWDRLIELRVEALMASPRPPDGILFWCPGPEFGGWRPTTPIYSYDDELELLTGENFEIDNILRAQELHANPDRDVNGNITGPGQPYPAIATTIHQVADYWATLTNPPRKAFYLGMLQGRIMEAIMARSVETAIDRVRRSIELVKLAEPDAIIIDASSSAIGRNNEPTRFVAGHPLFDYLIQLAKDPNEPRIVLEAIPGYQLERETRGQAYMAAWADFASVHPTINPLRVGKSADLTTSRGICYWLHGAMQGSDPWNQTNISAIDALGTVEHAFEDWDQIAGDLPPRANPAPLGFLADVTGSERGLPIAYNRKTYAQLVSDSSLSWRALGAGDLLDSSGNNLHATASGGVTFEPDPTQSPAMGKVFQTGPSAKLAGSHGQTALPLSLSLRWKVTTPPSGDRVIAAFETTGNSNPFYRLVAKSTGQIEMTRYSPGQTFGWGNFQVPNSEIPADGEWVHLLWVLEPKAARLYMNGKLVAWDGTPAAGQTINTPHLGAQSPDLHAPSLSPRLTLGEAGYVQDVMLFTESYFEEVARTLSNAIISLPTGEYWLIHDTRDLTDPTQLSREARTQGYSETVKNLTTLTSGKLPSGLIVRAPGSAIAGEQRLDALDPITASENRSGLAISNLYEFSQWRGQTIASVPYRRPLLPMYLWGGGVTEDLYSDLRSSPQGVAAASLRAIDWVKRAGFHGQIVPNATPGLSSESLYRDLEAAVFATDQTLAVQGWPLAKQTHLKGRPVVLTWDQRLQHPDWPGTIATADAMLAADAGPVLVLLDPNTTNLYNDCVLIESLDCSIGITTTQWEQQVASAPDFAEDPTLDPNDLYNVLGTGMSIPDLTSTSEMRLMHGTVEYDLMLEDLSSSERTTFVDSIVNAASEIVYTYLYGRFTPASIAASSMARRFATYFALKELTARRGNPQNDRYQSLWDQSLDMLSKMANGDLNFLKPPDLVEHERSGIAFVGFTPQPGVTPFGEPIRVNPTQSTNRFADSFGLRWNGGFPPVNQ